MKLFDRVKDSRIQQIITRQLGNSFSIRVTGGGSFFCQGLGITIKPFFAAIGDDGIAFINKAQVVLVLKWSDIYCIEKESTETRIYLTFWAPITDTLNVYSKEPPFQEFHDASIFMNDALVADKFFEIFEINKLNNGFSQESILLHNTWAKWGINEPITLEKFHEVNKDWATKELREISYEVWGDFLDAERFMYFVGRNVCSGKLPSNMLAIAFDEYKRLNTENSEYTLKSKLPDEKSRKTIAETTMLNLWEETNDTSQWFLVSVDVQFQEWVGNMPIKKRRAAARVYKGENEWTLLELHNDFHSGTTLSTLNWNEKKDANKINFGGNFVTFCEEDVARLTKILKSK
jgi:hypothetical protein